MNQTKKIAVHAPWNNLMGQIENLADAKSKEFHQTLKDLVSSRINRINRIRIYNPRAGKHGMVREFPIPAAKTSCSVLEQEEFCKIDDPGTAVVLTLEENGTISFGVESREAAIVGENLPLLEKTIHIDEPSIEFNGPKAEEFISAQDIADEIGVDKTTVIRRIKDNRLIGYQGFKRDWLIPYAQFKDRNIVLGIAEMIALFDNDHQETWFFLSSNFFYGDDNPRPIDRLRAVKRNDKAALEVCLEEFELVKNSYDHGDHF